MKVRNSIFFLTLMTVFLSSCSTTAIDIDKTALLEPESFIAERKDAIDQTVALGPQITVDLEQQQEISDNERREINKEERKNYIDVSSDQNGIFPITVNFENISIQDMAVMFSEITGRNILLGEEVEGRVTAKLTNVPWDKALDSILKIKKLAKYVDEEANIIRIHSQDVLVAQEEFDLKRIEDLQKTRDAQRAIEPIYTEIFRLYYTKASDISAEISSVMGSSTEGSESSLDQKVQITIDERLNSLIIKATKPELDLISRLIREVDVRTKQILIEAFIVEATDDFGKELGAKFGLSDPNLINSGSPNDYTLETTGVAGSQPETAGELTLGDTTGLIANNAVSGALGGIGFILGTSASNLKLELSASEKDGVTKVLSNPRVFTLDGEEAVIIQGEEIPYKTEAEGGGTDIQFKEAGVKLTVTPTIVGDGNIILAVKVEKKTAKSDEANPPITTREITTKLLIRDDTIVVIGGVFTQETIDATNKVPFFGDLPFVGKLFRYEKGSDIRKELLVFLAPRII
jgi:type IV pilus assembly protein PilQ|tara:strand:- start:378 stop:1934 length:1557 start_codon:yes stop_codon:yes gene_type:complete